MHYGFLLDDNPNRVPVVFNVKLDESDRLYRAKSKLIDAETYLKFTYGQTNDQ